jgi:signal transduction histidine kinase
MLFAVLTYVPAALGMLILALVVVERQRTTQNILYFLLSIELSLYMWMQFLTLISHDDIALTYLRVGAAVTNLIVFTLLVFCLSYTNRKIKSIRLFLSAIPLLVFLFLTFSPDLIQSVSVHDNGFSTAVGRLYYMQAAVLVVYLLVSLTILIYAQKALRGSEKARVQLLLLAFVVPIMVNALTNTVLLSVAAVQFLGPLSLVAFTGIVAYAIVRHRLFDVRLALARSTAYFLAIGTITLTYLGIVLFISHVLVRDITLGLRYQVINITIAVFVGLTFQPIKRFFDKITDRIFFRDAYDAQELLDNLNRLFVTHTDIEPLLRQSASLIASSLRAEFCFFGLKESKHVGQRMIGTGIRQVSPEDVMAIRRTTPRLHRKIIVTDDLEGKFEHLKKLLWSNEVAVLARLSPTANLSQEGIGYLVLGARRSGNPYSQQDLRILEIIVNELVIAIQNSLRFEEIQHFNETLQQNVGEATRKLRSTNEKLQALDATKDEFITMASHQLRTPLTSVKGYLSMVLEGDAGKLNAQQEQLLTQSYASSQRMVYLISDLLNLSRLNTGKFVIEPSPVDLRNVVLAEIDQLRETAKSRDVTIAYTNPPSFPKLMLDETKIHQVIMNFIDNAIYYTPAGGSITIDLRETPTAVEYRVIDNGIGVPRGEQHRLFTKFYRAPNAQRARPDGTGLGLFMAKKVIVAQGGAIIFESEEGKGSTFGFRFSKAKHAVASSKEQVPSIKYQGSGTKDQVPRTKDQVPRTKEQVPSIK